MKRSIPLWPQLREILEAYMLDRGAPVALYTVARELGHSSTNMIEDRYGHLHDRAVLGGSEEVEYRAEHHREKIGDRLEALACA